MSLSPPPFSFSWVIDGVLAAMAWPYNIRDTLEFLRTTNIEGVVTLNESSLDADQIEAYGLEYHHFRMADFAAPTPKQIEKFVRIVDEAKKEGNAIVVHCLAGMGRTGTMLACYLVNLGYEPRDAIKRVRRLRPGSIETARQEAAVAKYAKRLRSASK